MVSVGLAHLAPGIWVAVIGAVLGLVLARWYDRVPGRVLVLFGLVLLLFYGEVLVGGSVLLPLDNLRGEPPFLGLAATEPHGNVLQGDLLYLVHPLRVEVRRAVAAGAWPLWAPRMGAGMPLLADPQSQALQPLAAAGLALPELSAPGAVAALRMLVALIFAYLLLARLGAGRAPAVAGALAFGLGGFLQLWLGWPLANAAALLPAVLYAVVLASDRGARRDWILVIVALASLLVAGHPETVAYVLALAGGLTLLRAWREGRRDGARLLGRAAAAALLAALLAAPALLPFAAYLPETLRWSRTVAAAPGGAPPSAGVGEAERAAPATRLVQAAAPNALGNSRFARYWGLANSNEDAGAFVGTAALLAALLALPGWLPGPRPVRHEGAALAVAGGCLLLLALPGGALGVVPAAGVSGRLALPLSLALAVLAAATLERFRHLERPRWLVWAALPAAAGSLAFLHLWAVPAFAHPAEAPALEVLRDGWLHWHLRFLVAAAALLLLGRRRRWPALAMVALVVAELFLAHGDVNPPMPRRLAFPVTPALEAVLEERSGGGAAEGVAAGRVAAAGRVFLPNLAVVYGLSDARVFDPMAPMRYLGLLAPGIETWLGEIPLLGPAAPDLYDRLGVAWWLASPVAPCPEGTVSVHDGPDVRLCRRPEALPLIRTVAESGAGVAATRELPAGDRWSIRRSGAGPGRIETGIYAAPGWRVLADLRPVPARDEVLLAADLPGGGRRVDLLYRPASFLAGCLLAAAGLAVAAAWLSRPPALPGSSYTLAA